MMKKLFSVCVLLLIIFCSFSQDTINGIGKLKLGSSPEILKELGYLSTPVFINTRDDFKKQVYGNYKGKTLYSIMPNLDEKKSPIHSYQNPNVQVLYIPNYQVTSTVRIEGILLSYYKNELFHISIEEPNNLPEALSIKYGEPKREYKADEVEFLNKYGNKVTKEAETITTRWETNNLNISCVDIVNSDYTKSGEKYILRLFMLRDIETTILVDELEKTYVEEARKRLRDSQLMDLKGL